MKKDLSEIIERADALYGARARIENVRASMALLENAATDGVEDFELLWRTGRALFFLGQEEKRSAQEARALHKRGASTCARAVLIERQRVEGHFWRGVNLALQAQATRGALAALTLAWRAKRSLTRAALINPAYHAAGPLRVLARLKHKLPRMLGGSSTAEARAAYARAIEIAPANSVTRLYLAEMLLADGDFEHARRELEMLLNAPVDPAWEFESMRDRALAQEMLERLPSCG